MDANRKTGRVGITMLGGGIKDVIWAVACAKHDTIDADVLQHPKLDCPVLQLTAMHSAQGTSFQGAGQLAGP